MAPASLSRATGAKVSGVLRRSFRPVAEATDEIGVLSPQQQQDVPRVMEIAKKFGLEILPPPGA